MDVADGVGTRCPPQVIATSRVTLLYADRNNRHNPYDRNIEM